MYVFKEQGGCTSVNVIDTAGGYTCIESVGRDACVSSLKLLFLILTNCSFSMFE